jgi:hypothetical protein
MANHTDLPQAGLERQDAGFDEDSMSGTSASPPRFSRLALCVAAAGALAIGVFGTIAYGVWFNHDQQAYAEAIAGARQALGLPVAATRTAATTATAGESDLRASLAAAPGTPAPTSITASADTPQTASTSDSEEGNEQAIWSGQVARPPAMWPASAPLADTGVTDTPITPTIAPRPTQRTASYTGSTARPAKDARSAQQNQSRRASQANAKNQSGLFARMGMLFRHVNYPQHGSGRQQPDLYSHP